MKITCVNGFRGPGSPGLKMAGFLIIWGVGLALLGGCADQGWNIGKNILGARQQLAPVTAQAAATLFPLKPTTGQFRIVEGDDAGDDFHFSLTPDVKGWKFTYDQRQVTYLQPAADGALLITREDSLDDGVAVTYTPPIVALPANLTPRVPFKGQCQAVIRNLDDHSEVTRGSCRYQVELLGMQKVTTPAGTFKAAIVRVHRGLNLGMADVTVDILTAYVPGRGQIAERVDQTTVALGLFPVRDLTETRLDKPEGGHQRATTHPAGSRKGSK